LASELVSPSWYHVVWTTPLVNAAGAMPIGNGDIAAGVSTLVDGELQLLLSKNDADTWCGDLFMTGCVGSRGSVIEGRIADGKLVTWSITPEARRAEVIVYEAQAW
jgi:hypothetical protein